MNDEIQTELLKVLDDWHKGNEIAGLRIGHGHEVRQQLTHDCALQIITAALQVPGADHNFERFHTLAVDIANTMKLSSAEQGAAISLAWVAIHRGWAGAMVGFPDSHSTKLRRQAEA